MPSVAEEIPNLSGPVSLGTYKFTRRVRSKKNEARGSSELENSRPKDGQNKVTKSGSNLSPHSTVTPSSPVKLSSFQLLNPSTHESKVELKEDIPNRLDDSSLNNSDQDKLGVHEPSPPQYDQLELSHPAPNSSNSIHSNYLDGQKFQASNRFRSASLPARDYCPSQDPSALINSGQSSSESSEQDHSSFPRRPQFLSQRTSTTINPDRKTPQPASGRADSLNQLRENSSNHRFNVSTSIDRKNPQVSEQAHPLFSPLGSRLDTLRRPSQVKNSLSTLCNTDGQSSREPEKAIRLLPPQYYQRIRSELYRKVRSESHNSLTAHNQISQSRIVWQYPKNTTHSNHCRFQTRCQQLASTLRLISGILIGLKEICLIRLQINPLLVNTLASYHRAPLYACLNLVKKRRIPTQLSLPQRAVVLTQIHTCQLIHRPLQHVKF